MIRGRGHHGAWHPSECSENDVDCSYQGRMSCLNLQWS